MTPLDRLASALAAVLEIPLVVICTFDAHRQLFVGAHGLAGAARSERSAEPNMVCRQIMDCGRPSLVQDMRLRFPLAPRHRWGGFEVAGYAGVPLMSCAGSCIGTLAAFDRTPRTWRARDLAVLRAFGDAAAVLLDSLGVRHERDELEQELVAERQAAAVEHTSKRDTRPDLGMALPHLEEPDDR